MQEIFSLLIFSAQWCLEELGKDKIIWRIDDMGTLCAPIKNRLIINSADMQKSCTKVLVKLQQINRTNF